MVHVLDLLGCNITGPTTEEAEALAPGAIRDFLRFLRRHGEDVGPDAEIDVFVAQHITEGIWLGNGDPSIGFGPDLTPVSIEAMDSFIDRLEWMRLEMNLLLANLTEEQWTTKPVNGRPLKLIVEHVIEAEYNYMYAFGRIAALPAAGSIIKNIGTPLLDWFAHVRKHEIERLRGLTEKERSEPFIHWKYTRTARKVLRRMLEHQWEHLVEVRERMERLT